MGISDGDRPVVQGRGRRAWLITQLDLWRDRSIITEQQRGEILALYGSDADLLHQRRLRAFMTLVALAIVMMAAGLLLLIGYNWDAIIRPVKVGLIFALVVAAFVASAVCYRRQRPVAGELLALAGVLIFGAAIWLLAQVFHIRAHYPDGLWWWMIGAIIAAWAVGSRIILIVAVLLLGAWGVSEVGDFGRENLLFLAMAAVIGGLSVKLRSATGVILTAIALVPWLGITAADRWDMELGVLPLLVMLGCAYYTNSLGGWRKQAVGGRGWAVLGLAVVLVCLMPLTFVEINHELVWGAGTSGLDWVAVGLTVAVLMGWTVVGILRAGPRALRQDWPVVATAGVGLGLTLVAVLAEPARYEQMWAWGVTIVVSGLTIVLGAWLIERGLRLDRALSFFTGVIYILTFVMVRWVDLIGDMLSSAVLFFLVGAALLAAAVFWRRRTADKRGVTGGDAKEAGHA